MKNLDQYMLPYMISQPDSYLDFANLALPFYRDFIRGWFSHYRQA